MNYKKLLNLINSQKDSGVNLFTPTHNHIFTIVDFEWNGKKYLYLHNPKSHLLSIYDKDLLLTTTKSSLVFDYSAYISLYLNTLTIENNQPSIKSTQCQVHRESLDLYEKVIKDFKDILVDHDKFLFKIPISDEVLELFEITNEGDRVYLTIKDTKNITYQPRNCMFGSHYCKANQCIYTNVPHRYRTIIGKVTKDVVKSLEYPMKSFKHVLDTADERTKEQFRGSLKHLNNVLEYLTKFKNI